MTTSPLQISDIFFAKQGTSEFGLRSEGVLASLSLPPLFLRHQTSKVERMSTAPAQYTGYAALTEVRPFFLLLRFLAERRS